MKIKYTLVYEIETPDAEVTDDLETIGFVKSLHIKDLNHRYGNYDTVKILHNDFELTVKGNALRIPK